MESPGNCRTDVVEYTATNMRADREIVPFEDTRTELERLTTVCGQPGRSKFDEHRFSRIDGQSNPTHISTRRRFVIPKVAFSTLCDDPHQSRRAECDMGVKSVLRNDQTPRCDDGIDRPSRQRNRSLELIKHVVQFGALLNTALEAPPRVPRSAVLTEQLTQVEAVFAIIEGGGCMNFAQINDQPFPRPVAQVGIVDELIQRPRQRWGNLRGNGVSAHNLNSYRRSSNKRGEFTEGI